MSMRFTPSTQNLGRQAILFSMIAILLSAFFILLFWSANAPSLLRTTAASETRVAVMNQYLSSWDSYVQDALRLSIRGALIVMAEQITDDAKEYPLEAMTRNLSLCLETGSFNPEGVMVSCSPGGVHTSFRGRLSNFTALAQDELGVTTTYTLGDDYSIMDAGPFELLVRFTMNYTVGDSFAEWNRTDSYNNYTVIVSVVGLPDPLFARYGSRLTGGSHPPWPRNITKFLVPRSKLSKRNLSDLIGTHAYIENLGMGPTYLERLAGKIDCTSNQCDAEQKAGIETLIDINEIPSYSFSPGEYFNYSHVAHQLFNHELNGLDGPFRCGNETMGIDVSDGNFSYPHFRLDIPHIARFNMNNVTLWNATSCYS